jgi:hypothetical protein
MPIVESSAEDPIFPHWAATETVAQLRLLYDYLGGVTTGPKGP